MTSTHASVQTPASFASRAVFTFGTNLAVAFLSLGNVFVVSRVLGPSGRGEVAFLTTIAFLASNLATFGIQESNANIAGREASARRALATNSLILSALFGVGAIATLGGLITLFPGIAGDDRGPLMWATLASIPMLILQLYLRMIAQASYGFGVTNAAWLLGPVVNVVGNATAAAFGLLSVTTAVLTWIMGQAIGTALVAWWIVRKTGFGRPDLSLVRRSIGFGLKSHPGRVMLLGNYRLDQWILGAIAGERELGLYSVAVAWSETLFYLPTSLSLVQRPDLVRSSRSSAVQQTARAFRAGMIATAALATAIFIAAPFLCVTIFGSEFQGSVSQLRILTAGAFGIAALKQLGNALTAQQLPLLTSAMTAVAFVVVTVLDFVLIPGHGGVGASYASTIAYTVGGAAIAAAFIRALGARAADLVPRFADVLQFWSSAVASLRLRPALLVRPKPGS
jgi:O-antigen/teichoic acid export membrane protein